MNPRDTIIKTPIALKPFLGPRSLAAALSISLIVGCSPIRETHGYIPPDAHVERVKVGEDSRAEVQGKLGRPSTSAAFDDDEWYYIARTTKTVAFFAPEVEDQKVLVVAFNDDGIVSEVDRYGLEDGQVIDLVTRTTPTRGQRLTFLQQLIGNIGRISATDLTGG